MSNVISLDERAAHLRKPSVYLEANVSCTPDFKELNLGDQEFHLVMVVDDVKKDHTYHGYVENGAYFGKATTNLHTWMGKINPHGDTPLVFDCRNYKLPNGVQNAPVNMLGKIEGEIWAIPLRALTDLDLLMQNTMAVDRKEVWVCMNEQPRFPSTKVWMYVAKWEYFDNGNDEILHMKPMDHSEFQSIGGNPYGRRFYYHDPEYQYSSVTNKTDYGDNFDAIYV